MEIKNEKEALDIINNNDNVHVMFTADWCGICQQKKKAFAEQEIDAVKIIVNAEECETLRELAAVEYIPMVVFFEKGKRKGLVIV